MLPAASRGDERRLVDDVRGFYETDLAFVHDDGFRAHAQEAAPFLIERLRRRGIRNGRIADLGSGSGLPARELCAAGYDVVGIEVSAAMVRLARKTAPAARFVQGSVFEVDLPACAAVVSTGECLNYVVGRKNSLPALFARVAGALSAGGVFLFDFADLERGRGARPMHRIERDWAVTVDYRHDRAGRRLERRITTFRRVGKAFRRSDEVHRVRLFQPSEIAAQLRDAGFRVRFFRGYGTRFPRGLRGIEAVKAGTTTP